MISFINKYGFQGYMTAPRLRSRSLRRIFTKVPGGRTKLHYKKRKPEGAKCGSCGDLLKGVPREFPFRISKMAKTKKRPERPYGGVLCSRCMRLAILDKTRQ